MFNPFRWVSSRVLDFFEGPGPRIAPGARVGRRRWVDKGSWVNVKSSWCSAIRYDKEASQLFVKFNNGVVCVYPNISPDLAARMFQSNSMGRFVHQNLKGRPYARTRG